ncbi:hypothetical protein BGX29_012152 [Mortierella sp. GBA35]|nr:hypothetical protein BGX29_012152 [Mortierella sp. GBA35]
MSQENAPTTNNNTIINPLLDTNGNNAIIYPPLPVDNNNGDLNMTPLDDATFALLYNNGYFLQPSYPDLTGFPPFAVPSIAPPVVVPPVAAPLHFLPLVNTTNPLPGAMNPIAFAATMDPLPLAELFSNDHYLDDGQLNMPMTNEVLADAPIVAPTLPEIGGLVQEMGALSPPRPQQVVVRKVFKDRATGAMFWESRDEVLGGGGFGQVHEVVDIAGKKFALKMPKETEEKDMATIDFLRRVQGHKNVVKFVGTVDDDTGKGLLLKLYEPTDFKQLLAARGALTKPEVQFFTKQLVEGMNHVHGAGIIHCDMKPANVLVGKGMKLKISDFGLAEDAAVPSYSRKGTAGFLAPEVVNFEKHTFALDVFSLGCIVYMMMKGEKSGLTTWDEVKRAPNNFYNDIPTSDLGKKFVKGMLEKDSKRRYRLVRLIGNRFLTEGHCPTSLPITVFHTTPRFPEEDEQQGEQAAIEGEDNEPKKRKRQNDKETEKERRHKGKEVVRGKADVKDMADQEEILDDFYHRKREAQKRWDKVLAEVGEEKKDFQAEEDELKARFGDDINITGLLPRGHA